MKNHEEKHAVLSRQESSNLHDSSKILVQQKMNEWGIDSKKAEKWFTALFTALQTSRKENSELRETLKRQESLQKNQSNAPVAPSTLFQENKKLKSKLTCLVTNSMLSI